MRGKTKRLSIGELMKNQRIGDSIQPKEESLMQCLVVPIKMGKGVIGSLNLFGTEKFMPGEIDFEFFASIGSHIGMAARNARLYQETNQTLEMLRITQDKLVESGLVRILEQIYEQDFIDDSYGFRPDRSCHDALRALNVTLERGGTEWVVEADIKGFFDTVDHDWLIRFLAHRVADQRVLRMVKRFLKAGVCEDGQFYVSDEGVPQGGSISPILANVYLH